MTNAPYLADGARAGFRYGNTELRDSIIADGLWCAFDACLMGLGTALRRVRSARRTGRLRRPVARAGRGGDQGGPPRRGDRPRVDRSAPRPRRQRRSCRRRARRGRASRNHGREPEQLRPAFDPAGSVTAGNASQLSDGASAVVMMSTTAAERRGVTPLGELVSYGMVAGPDSASLLHQPSGAIQGAAPGRAGDRRRRPVRDQRGLRRGRAGVDGRPRHPAGRRQRQRGSDRPRPPDRDERQPPRPHAVARAASTWRGTDAAACVAAAVRATRRSSAPSPDLSGSECLASSECYAPGRCHVALG